MHKGRLEAFSDGVIAIILTIMVLELKVPHGDSVSDLMTIWPVFLSYILSFIYIGIYWNNHHHTLQVAKSVSGSILWANMLLLFWLSLVPFATAWMGENHFSKVPVALYGGVLLMAALSYYLWSHLLVRHHGKNSILAKAYGADLKGKISLVLYLVALAFSSVQPLVSCAIYALVAAIWLVPDRRIERLIEKS
jgi:uncharacterized membrane protein